MRVEMIGGPMDGYVMDIDDNRREQSFHAYVPHPDPKPWDLIVNPEGFPAYQLRYRRSRKVTSKGHRVYWFKGIRR